MTRPPIRRAAPERRFNGAGIDVVHEQSGGADEADRFAALYERTDLDVLWVIGHGAFAPYAAHRSSLDILESGSITLERAAQFNVRRSGTRRLLVLNVCNAGNVSGLSGVAQAGLVGLLTSPVQATVAHLWSADLEAAAVLGIFLARSLANGVPYLKPFVAAMNGLNRPNEEIANDLAAFAVDHALVQRVRRALPPIADYVRSGSAVFYE